MRESRPLPKAIAVSQLDEQHLSHAVHRVCIGAPQKETDIT